MNNEIGTEFIWQEKKLEGPMSSSSTVYVCMKNPTPIRKNTFGYAIIKPRCSILKK